MFQDFGIGPSRDLVQLIEQSAHELTKSCLKDLVTHWGTPTYHTYNEQELYQRAYTVYSQLGKWISRTTSKEDIAHHYMALGAQRRKEGFPLAEVVQALILIRRHLWFKVLRSGFLDTALELHQALDLNNRVLIFFDRAIYYTCKGYEQDMMFSPEG